MGQFRQMGRWIGRPILTRTTKRAARHGPRTLVVTLDGTMSSLEPGDETSIGLIWKLLTEEGSPSDIVTYYEPGIQYSSWRQLRDVIEGKGINQQIRRTYGWLASRYRPGDRIYLFGYSRGAYAVRSLAGLIDDVGLLRRDVATDRNVVQAYRHYRMQSDAELRAVFRRLHCHEAVPIEMIGAFDTVKALGMRGPLLGPRNTMETDFHNHGVGGSVRRAYHALALQERRVAYDPILWCPDRDWDGICEQVWFRGSHGDVGGHLSGSIGSRPLANIPLVWMLDRAERSGLILPAGWRARFGCDVDAPSCGMNQGFGKLLLARKPRVVGMEPSERLHVTAAHAGGPGYDMGIEPNLIA
ncbi:DUF2235 domain-containing protein [Palleronia caenipelagi]|nr:DUF2235 domain-containing protein [Palleronia caenipelagi]